MANKRKRIPDNIKLKLWAKSAGRCQFPGCNKSVWQNSLTLSEANFAEIAHIIGSSNKGPRGNECSEELQTDFSNLMLLCNDCHDEIDYYEKAYGVDLLKDWKSKHEERIEVQTQLSDEINKSTILTFTARIQDRMPSIPREAIKGAMFNNHVPKFPVDWKGLSISFEDFDCNGDTTEWELAATKIKSRIEQGLRSGIDGVNITHLSIFAIGPMPLLMYLGKCIGDTIPTNIFQAHRHIEDTHKTWTWHSSVEDELSEGYLIEKVKVYESTKNVMLLLEISDYLNPDKYEGLADDSFSIYKLCVQEPHTRWMKYPKQLETFSTEYRKLLNQIQALHGNDCNIYLCPSVPLSIAVECGRAILPTKDPNIFACQYNQSERCFKLVLKIN
ncbi:MAG: HNH endonuclease [Saprospiraceae bacterium]